MKTADSTKARTITSMTNNIAQLKKNIQLKINVSYAQIKH